MMRILHVGKYYPPSPGGMEKVVQLLCEGERPFVESRVLAANTAPVTVSEDWRGVPVTRVASYAAIGSVGLCPSFPRALARIPRDVTVLHEPNPLALVSDFVARQLGPLVVWFHSEVLRPRWKYRLMYRPFLRRVLARAARIVVSSPLLAAHAAELGDYRHKCTVIPFGIDVARFAQTPELVRRADEMRARYGSPLALFVGRLVPYKGVDVLIDAVAGLPLTTLVVGEGPERAALEARAAARSARVAFAGEVDNETLAALYTACDLFVLPSVTRAEAFGMVQLEAMASGKPVISTNLQSGVPWVNRHGETGLVVEPGDAAALRDAIVRLMNDAELRGTLGQAASARVLREFTVSQMVTRTVSLYREVAAGPA
jgi:rhamnosyl/mannosyltransferase